MSESAKKTCGKIKATRNWLNRAESHFGQDASARGEIDLLLAEAELRSTREQLQPKRHSLWFQHGMALGTAGIILVTSVASAGMWLVWRNTPGAQSAISPVTITTPVVEPSPLPAPVPAVPVQNQKPAEPSSAAAVPASPVQEVNKGEKAVVQEPAVSPDEMKRLVRTAGQSLRGQTRP